MTMPKLLEAHIKYSTVHAAITESILPTPWGIGTDSVVMSKLLEAHISNSQCCYLVTLITPLGTLGNSGRLGGNVKVFLEARFSNSECYTIQLLRILLRLTGDVKAGSVTLMTFSKVYTLTFLTTYLL